MYKGRSKDTVCRNWELTGNHGKSRPNEALEFATIEIGGKCLVETTTQTVQVNDKDLHNHLEFLSMSQARNVNVGIYAQQKSGFFPPHKCACSP